LLHFKGLNSWINVSWLGFILLHIGHFILLGGGLVLVLKIFSVGKVDFSLGRRLTSSSFMEELELGIQVCWTALKLGVFCLHNSHQRKWKISACWKSGLSEWRFVADLLIIYAAQPLFIMTPL